MQSLLIRLTLFHLLISIFGAFDSLIYNVGVFFIGIWALHSEKSDPPRIFLLILFISILLDIVWLSVYGDDVIDSGTSTIANTQKFALSMSIISLLVKPVTFYYCYKLCGFDGGQTTSYQPEVQYGGTHGFNSPNNNNNDGNNKNNIANISYNDSVNNTSSANNNNSDDIDNNNNNNYKGYQEQSTL